MNIFDARDAKYTSPLLGEFPCTFFHYCNQSGTKDEQGGYALIIVQTWTGSASRIVERERVVVL